MRFSLAEKPGMLALTSGLIVEKVGFMMKEQASTARMITRLLLLLLPFL